MTDKVFPVIYSTIATEAIVRHILPEYDIESPISCQFWHRGLSDIYIIKTRSQQYVLRISHHHWRTKSEIYFELELLDFLKKRKIPVAYPILTKEGDLAVRINAPEGWRYAALFMYASGKVPVGDFNLIQSQILGKTVARLHQVSSDFVPRADRAPLDLEYLLDQSLGAIAPFLAHRHQDFAELLEIAEEIREKITQLPQKYPFWTICWGDPHSGNVHFTPDNRVTLFDFDQCGYGWRAFEIGKFLQVSLGAGLSKPIREAFLESYQNVNPMTKLELALIQSFTQTAFIWMWAISLTNAQLHYYSKLDHLYFTHRLEALKRLHSKDWQLF